MNDRPPVRQELESLTDRVAHLEAEVAKLLAAANEKSTKAKSVPKLEGSTTKDYLRETTRAMIVGPVSVDGLGNPIDTSITRVGDSLEYHRHRADGSIEVLHNRYSTI
jgi:hypothetical protein